MVLLAKDGHLHHSLWKFSPTSHCFPHYLPWLPQNNLDYWKVLVLGWWHWCIWHRFILCAKPLCQRLFHFPLLLPKATIRMDTVCWGQREINYDNPRDGPRFLAHWHQSSKCYSYCRQASIKEIIYKEKWLTTLIEICLASNWEIRL